jgi:hypothetical protein
MLTRKQKWRMTIKRVNFHKNEKIKKNIVVFNNIVNVILIPKIEENDDLKEHYWWSQDDINHFKKTYLCELGKIDKYKTI